MKPQAMNSRFTGRMLPLVAALPVPLGAARLAQLTSARNSTS